MREGRGRKKGRDEQGVVGVWGERWGVIKGGGKGCEWGMEDSPSENTLLSSFCSSYMPTSLS